MASINQPVLLGVFEGYIHDPDFNLPPLPLTLGNLHTVRFQRVVVCLLLFEREQAIDLFIITLKIPSPPRIRTVPLPPLTPEGETSTSLATAKPNIIENETRSEVSGSFYPAEDHAL